MKVERIFTRNVLSTTRTATLAEAAATMRRYKVGALLVTAAASNASEPVGIVTDRDLAMQGFTAEANTVGDAMTPIVAMIREDAEVHEALETMRAHGVRRLVVTTARGRVTGMLSIDDIVDGLAIDIVAAAAVLRGEVKHDSAGLGHVKVG